MQQVQQRELPERISWARALIFAVGFFFLSIILIGQLPGYIYLQMTAASLQGMEQSSIALAVVCLGGFVVIQVILMLFDPKPVVPPMIFTVIGVPLFLAGLTLSLWAYLSDNQFFPRADTLWSPLLGGKFLWFQPNSVDLVMVGMGILGVGLAMVFYSVLALREQSNPDRRDLGTTPAVRGMLIVAIFLFIAFLIVYTLVNPEGLALRLGDKAAAEKIITLTASTILGAAILLAFGAFALRLHYLMRPVRKRTMPGLYAIGTIGLAQTGAILLLVWIVLYPLIYWMHGWTFIGLNDYLTVCAKKTAIPASCSFSQQAGYIIDAIVTTNFLAVLLGGICAWKSNRILVVVGGVVLTAVCAIATLLVHTDPGKLLLAMLLCGGMLVLATIWTAVSRREFAVVGENNLGCLGQWLIVGTCLLVYLAAFGLFSLPALPPWPPETEPNIPFVAGLIVPPPANSESPVPILDALIMFVTMGILAAIQLHFLVRNRYKV